MDAQSRAASQAQGQASKTKEMVVIHERKEIIAVTGAKPEAAIEPSHQGFVDLCAAGPDLLFDTASIPSPIAIASKPGAPQGYVFEPMS